MDPEHTPQSEETDPFQQFVWHVFAVCAIAMLALILDASAPDKPAGPIPILCAAIMIRWTGIEQRHGESAGLMSSIVLDAGLGLMAADIIAFWT